MTYGTKRRNAYAIIEDSLNLRDTRIYDTIHDPDGSDKRVLNVKETMLAQQKQEQIREAFKSWIWKDPERRADHSRISRYLYVAEAMKGKFRFKDRSCCPCQPGILTR